MEDAAHVIRRTAENELTTAVLHAPPSIKQG